MQKALFIDFDGTICFDLFWRSLDVDFKDQVTEFLFVNNAHLVDEWMRGRHTSEDINLMISQNLKIKYEHIWEIFVKDCQEMMVREETLNFIQRAKTNFKTILITDNMDCFDRFTIPKLSLFDTFDYIENSYNYKILKSSKSGDFFKKVAAHRKVNIEDSILIDNSIDNCIIFESLGGKSISVLNPEDIDNHLQALL